MAAGDNFDKYALKSRTEGRLCLADPLDDQVARLLAEDTDPAEILSLLPEVDQRRIDRVAVDPLAQRRVKYLREHPQRETPLRRPETPDECLKFVKQKLVRIANNTEVAVKDQVTALKALADVAMDERENKPQESGVILAPDMEKLKQAYGSEGNG